MEPALLDKDVFSAEDLLKITDAHRFDLVDGNLVERHMGSVSSWVGSELHALLRDYCRRTRFGWTWHADAGFDCFRRTRSVRYPDVVALRYGRLPGEILPDGHIEVVPDFVAEVVSPHDKADELEEKIRDYRTAGIRLIWVIYPALRIARAHRADRTITEYGPDEVMSGEAVLPGFEVRLRDLFPLPPAPVPPSPPSPPPS